MDTSNWNILTDAAESDVEVKKSHFLCELKLVHSEEEAKDFIDSIRKKHYDARHHCFAMRIGTPSDVFERSGDDGEPSGTAGKPMLEILKGAGIYDVCAVVTRYFGGTLLGTGGLVRAYSDSLKGAINLSDFAPVLEGIRFKVKCGYSAAEKIKRQAANMGLSSMGEEYAEDCTLNLLSPKAEADAFADKVIQLSMGQAQAEWLGEVLYYDEKAPKIYSDCAQDS